MNLKFYKESEDATKVNYWIETNAYEKTSTAIIKIPVKGLCIFNKSTQTISFDPEKTDTYFFERTNEPLMIEAHLKKIFKKQNGFPETYSIVTC